MHAFSVEVVMVIFRTTIFRVMNHHYEFLWHILGNDYILNGYSNDDTPPGWVNFEV